VASILWIVTLPAEKWRITFADLRSTIAMWLFSWRVTTALLSSLTSTNSASGSSGAVAASPVRATVSSWGVAESSVFRSSTLSVPAGSWGMSPSLSSSSRSFSITIAAWRWSGEIAIESGCPPSGIVLTICLVAMFTTARWPDGATSWGWC
jgi:hypothetical protein